MEPISYHENRLKAFTTKHLNMLLQLDCDGILPLDLDTILKITEILAERRNAEDPDSIPNVEDAYRRFTERLESEGCLEGQTESVPVSPPALAGGKPNLKGKGNSGFVIKWVAAILAFVFIVGSAPAAFGATSVFERIAQWTDDVFTFFNPSPYEQIYHSPSNNLNTLFEIVKQGEYIPKWLPEDMTWQVVHYRGDKSSASIYAHFTHGEKDLGIVFRLLADNSNTKYMKDKTDVELYVAGDQTHYIMSNNAQLTCAWITDTVECTIYGDLTREEMHQIIDSIYSKP